MQFSRAVVLLNSPGPLSSLYGIYFNTLTASSLQDLERCVLLLSSSSSSPPPAPHPTSIHFISSLAHLPTIIPALCEFFSILKFLLSVWPLTSWRCWGQGHPLGLCRVRWGTNQIPHATSSMRWWEGWAWSERLHPLYDARGVCVHVCVCVCVYVGVYVGVYLYLYYVSVCMCE